MTILPQAPRRDEEVLPFLKSLMVQLSKALSSGDIAELASQLSAIKTVPIGGLVPYAGTTTPEGFLDCDGSTYEKETYADLYTAIGDLWATGGEPAEQFRVPSLNNRTVRGGASVGTYVGSDNVNIGQTHLPAYNLQVTDPGHTHGVTDPGHAHSSQIPDTVAATGAVEGTQAGNTGSATTGISVNSATTGITVNLNGGGNPLSVIPSAGVVKWIIRAL